MSAERITIAISGRPCRNHQGHPLIGRVPRMSYLPCADCYEDWHGEGVWFDEWRIEVVDWVGTSTAVGTCLIWRRD